jgi:hypothetical protein
VIVLLVLLFSVVFHGDDIGGKIVLASEVVVSVVRKSKVEKIHVVTRIMREAIGTVVVLEPGHLLLLLLLVAPPAAAGSGRKGWNSCGGLSMVEVILLLHYHSSRGK